MPAPRTKRDSEEVRRAWTDATGVSRFCEILRMSYNQTAARRMCAENGLTYPAPHWGQHERQPPPPEAPPERLRHEMDVERAEVKAREAVDLLRAAKGEIRTQREFLAAVLEAATDAVPAPDFPPLKQDTHKPHRSVVVQISD